MNTANYFLPEYLLPYLFNGDASGLTDKEKAKYDAWEAAEFPGGAWAISSVPAGFLHGNDFDTLAGECREVTFQLPDDASNPEQPPPLEERISADDLRVIQAMRARGWAVALFTPAELGGVDSEDVEDRMIAAGNDWLTEHQE